VLGYIVWLLFDLELFLCLHVRLICALNYYLTWIDVLSRQFWHMACIGQLAFTTGLCWKTLW